MFKGIFNGNSLLANAKIPITVSMNTNSRTGYDSNNVAIKLNESGYYDVEVVANITTSSASTVILQAYANGNALNGVYATATPASSGDTVTLSLTDIVKVVKDTYPNVAELSFSCDEAVANVTGVVTVKYEK